MFQTFEKTFLTENIKKNPLFVYYLTNDSEKEIFKFKFHSLLIKLKWIFCR